jgi:hypothetical protein
MKEFSDKGRFPFNPFSVLDKLLLDIYVNVSLCPPINE